jgi:hypothetical protein
MIDRAEQTMSCAEIPEYEIGRALLAPALPNIGAMGGITDGFEAQLPVQLAYPIHVLGWNMFDPEPVRPTCFAQPQPSSGTIGGAS